MGCTKYKTIFEAADPLGAMGVPIQAGNPIKEGSKHVKVGDPSRLSIESPARISQWHGTLGNWANVGFTPGPILLPRNDFTLQKYEQCIKFKSRPQRAGMENIQATYPLQLVHLKFLTIELTEGGKDVHILIITDDFMRYAQPLVTSSQTAKCTIQVLWDWFIVYYGLPECIISDQGQNFESDLISELCQLAKIQKLCTSPYHLQTNVWCERFTITLINMLGTLPPNKKSSWRHMVPTLVHACNCTRSTATGFNPYYLMYGKKPRLPVDLYFGTQKAGKNKLSLVRWWYRIYEIKGREMSPQSSSEPGIALPLTWNSLSICLLLSISGEALGDYHKGLLPALVNGILKRNKNMVRSLMAGQ